MRKLIPAALAAIALTLGAAACSSSAEEPTGTSTSAGLSFSAGDYGSTGDLLVTPDPTDIERVAPYREGSTVGAPVGASPELSFGSHTVTGAVGAKRDAAADATP